MPRLMADIFPMNLACQAAVHYTTLRHAQADVLHASVCVCVCAGQWRVIGRPWPISVAWLKKVKKNGRHWGRAVVNSVPHQCISVSSTPFWWLTVTSGLCAHSHVHIPMARYVCTYPYTYTARKWRSTLLKQKSITQCNQWSHTPGELVFNLLTSKDQKCLIQRHIQSIEVDMCRRKKKIFCGFFSSPLFHFAPLNPFLHPDCFPQSSSLLHFCFTLFLFIG